MIIKKKKRKQERINEMEEHLEQKIYRYNRNIETEKFITLTTNSEEIEDDSTIVCKPEEIEGLLELANNLRKHDWTFEMSDDHRYWRAGTEELSRLRSLIARHGSAGKKLFHFFYPEDSRGSHRKEDYLPGD